MKTCEKAKSNVFVYHFQITLIIALALHLLILKIYDHVFPTCCFHVIHVVKRKIMAGSDMPLSSSIFISDAVAAKSLINLIDWPPLGFSCIPFPESPRKTGKLLQVQNRLNGGEVVSFFALFRFLHFPLQFLLRHFISFFFILRRQDIFLLTHYFLMTT